MQGPRVPACAMVADGSRRVRGAMVVPLLGLHCCAATVMSDLAVGRQVSDYQFFAFIECMKGIILF